MVRLSTEKRKKQIADEVLAVIMDAGFEGLSMPVLARRLGVVPSALYRHFRNKDEMIQAGIGEFFERVRAVITDSSVKDDPLTGFRNLMVFQRKYIPAAMVIPRAVFGLGQVKSKSLRGKLHGELERVIGLLAGQLKEGQKSGKIRKDIDSETMALHFWGVLVSGALKWFLTEGEFDLETYHEDAWKMFTKAVMHEPGVGKGKKEKPRKRGVSRK